VDSDHRAADAAALLATARRDHRPIAGLPESCLPRDIDQAYAAQRGFVERILQDEGGQAVGYKIGCTNPLVQGLLDVDEPFYGRILSSSVLPSGTALRREHVNLCCIEAELAFELAEDLPVAAAPYDPDGVASAVAQLMGAIEIVDSRFEDWTRVGAASLIADNASAGHWIKGAAVAQWRHLELDQLSVELIANEQVVRTGSGVDVMEHPLNALAWLANVLCFSGDMLKAGDVVSTGTMIDVYFAAPGDRLQARFEGLGEVALRIE
jgi:2-oxo-3-hexenedioate decarboxylase/2-keto-4-pentenoate hydratase